jgi:peptidoglycan/xylan/chitin deacetylase (PgdA/CDA1 family)
VVALADVKRRLREAVFDAMPGGRLLYRGPAALKRVALTFDDGPDELTPEYLDVLDRLGVPATFFIMGDLSEARPALIREYVRRGHQIASHGYDHRRFTELSWKELEDQLVRSSAAIGPQPVGRPWVRPPHGTFDTRVAAQLLASNWVLAMWSLDSQDYSAPDADTIVARCAPDNVRPGEVILFHESQRTTLEALPRIVQGLEAAGYECVTMADLFAV